MQLLLEMLTYRRPHLSATEDLFIKTFLLPLPGARQDAFGNVIVKVGESDIMWSSHTDTVHTKDGFQKVCVDKQSFAFTEDMESNCLGADCTTGVWLMVEMIKKSVPGLYVFHRGEEKGGLGSDWIVKNTPELVTGIKACIAFDRMKLTSIITFQYGERCCSDDFANSLSDILELGHKTDDTGSFTDSANYTDLIGECTNVSVGYYSQHSWREYQDMLYAEQLLEALINFDPSTLRFSRKPGAKETKWSNYGYGAGSYAYSHDAMYYYGKNEKIRDITRLARNNACHLAKALASEGVSVDVIEQLIQKGKTLDNEGEPVLTGSAFDELYDMDGDLFEEPTMSSKPRMIAC